MYGGFPFRALSPRYPMPQERRRERETVMRRWRQQRFARSLMRGLTPQSRVHPSGAEAVKTLDFRAAESNPLFCRPRYENCTLAIFILATASERASANKYGTHKSVCHRPKAELCQIRYVSTTTVMLGKCGEVDLLHLS